LNYLRETVSLTETTLGFGVDVVDIILSRNVIGDLHSYEKRVKWVPGITYGPFSGIYIKMIKS
jgi:hypothetical protein